MTLFNDLWKKFKVLPPESDTKTSPSGRTSSSTLPHDPPFSTSAPPHANENQAHGNEKIDQVLNSFQQAELESLESDRMIAKLLQLKEVVNQPKEEHLEVRFSKIKENLGPAESHETVRQERWPDAVECPECRSNAIKRIAQLPGTTHYKHRYRCLECGAFFNDDSGTPMERELPPLNVWMHCWYLMGCTDSLIYIANKLGLDLGTVELMVQRLRETFHTQKPLTKFLNFEEWNKQSQHLRAQLKDDLLREYERLNANVATVPKDSAEYRRQLNLRRDLKPSTAPPSGGRKR